MCKIEKPVTEFHRLFSASDGHRYDCKRCRTKKNSPGQYERLVLLEENKKKCPACNEVKSLDKFSISLERRDGHRGYCKECRNIKDKEYYYNNIDRYREHGKLRTRKWISNPENAEKNRQSSRDYYHEHKEESLERQRNWRRGKGRNKLLLQLHRRRDRINSVENTLTDYQIEFLLEFQNHKCTKCGIIFHNDYTLDHIVPLSMGKGLTLENTQLLCRSCNSSKGAKAIQYREDIDAELVLGMI